MKTFFHFFLWAFCALALPLQAQQTDSSGEYWQAAPGLPKLSKKDYAPREGLAPFSARDVPRQLPKQGQVGMRYVVQHSNGYSTVEILFSRYVNLKAFSPSGKGEALPVSVRLSPRAQGFALYQKKNHRSLDLSQTYKISGRVYRKSNRKSAAALTREVLERTFCKGGVVTENHDMGEFVKLYGRKSKVTSPEGFGVLPGVVVEYRCSRWRAR